MKYLPGMETMEESDVMEQVITAMNAYDYDQYMAKQNANKTANSDYISKDTS